MLGAQEHDREILVVITPTDNVHHRLDFVILLRQGFIQTTEQLFVAILRSTTDEHSRAGVLLDERDVLTLVELYNL